MTYFPNQEGNNNSYMQSPNINQQANNSQNFTNNLAQDVYSNKNPGLLRRRYRSP
jgi:hypothetical protein